MAMIGDWEAEAAASSLSSTTTSSSSSSLLPRESDSSGGQGSSNNNRLKMNFVDVVAAATRANIASSGDGGGGDGGGGDGRGDGDGRGGGDACAGSSSSGSEEEESNHEKNDATIINSAGPKLSKIPLPPPMPQPLPPASFDKRPVIPVAQSIKVSNISGKSDSNWYKSWPPAPVKMSKEQAEARHLVLNEIKELQLRRQTSFKRILKLPIWGSGKINNV